MVIKSKISFRIYKQNNFQLYSGLRIECQVTRLVWVRSKNFNKASILLIVNPLILKVRMAFELYNDVNGHINQDSCRDVKWKVNYTFAVEICYFCFLLKTYLLTKCI